MTLRNKINDLEKSLIVIETENKQLNSQIGELQRENILFNDNIQQSINSVSFIEKLSMSKRESMKKKIEFSITEALKNVYGNEYSIVFDYSIKNNRTSAELKLVKKAEVEVKRDMDGFGGGVSDSISFPLKVMVLMASNKCDRILIADEPGKHLSISKVDKFFQFVQQISKKLKMQVIMCTHHQSAAKFADMIYKFQINNGETTVECSPISR